MDRQYHYQAVANWTRERCGEVSADPQAPRLTFSAPPEFQGEAGVWTPEHFLVAAVAACFITTFRAISEFSRFQFEALQVSAEGTLDKAEGGLRFTRVLLRPSLTVSREEDRDRGLRLLEKAERSCLVARSLQSQIELRPAVQVAAPLAH